jgi:hypothetical protein
MIFKNHYNLTKAASSTINFVLPFLSMAGIAFPDHSQVIAAAVIILEAIERHIRSSRSQENLS